MYEYKWAVVVAAVIAILSAVALTYFSLSYFPSSTTTTVTVTGKTIVTTTQPWPASRPLPENLTGTIYKTSGSSQGLTFTMEYNGTAVRTGEEAIAFRLTLENVNNTSGSVGTSDTLAPFYVDIYNSSSSRPIDGFGNPRMTTDDHLVALKPGDKVSRYAIYEATMVVGIGNLMDNYLARVPRESPGPYQFIARITVLDPADGHELFTIQTQPVTITVLPP